MPELSWIPFFGPLIIAFRASKMHWWPWLLLIGVIIPYIGLLFFIVFLIFNIIWRWRLFEAVRKPGWLAIFTIIPIVDLIIIGIVAWSKK